LDYYQFSFANEPKPCFYSLVKCWSKGLPGNNTFNIDTDKEAGGNRTIFR